MLIIRDGVAWKAMPDGMQETADPGECADEIERLHAALQAILNLKSEDMYHGSEVSHAHAIARAALESADKMQAAMPAAVFAERERCASRLEQAADAWIREGADDKWPKRLMNLAIQIRDCAHEQSAKETKP